MKAGIFGLHTPNELLNQLEQHFSRLKADEGQQTMVDTAFDFYVSGYPLIDWMKKHMTMTNPETCPWPLTQVLDEDFLA